MKGRQAHIVVPGWHDFTHRDARRSFPPPWLKVATRLHGEDPYCSLTLSERGLLLGIWIEYGLNAGNLPADTRRLARRLGCRVTRKALAALEGAGYIEITSTTGQM